jgi:hypothetical protein
MSTIDLRPPAPPAPWPGRAVDADSQVLASALAQLLERDGERPARWSTPSFSLAVETARQMPLDGPSTLGHQERLDFAAAAVRLARDPWAVALAIRQLERRAQRRLPPWIDLVDAGLRTRPSALDTALWFG